MTGVDIWYKLMTGFPEINIFFIVHLSGGITAGCRACCSACPRLRIKGFYLAVATLAAQFFLVWLFNKVAWFYNYSASGQINAPERMCSAFARDRSESTAPWATYLFCLVLDRRCALVARNLTRGTIGRKWMAIRDMDIAAEIIGVNPLKAKLSAFAVSSFFIGMSRGAVLCGLSGRGRSGRGLWHHQVVPGPVHGHHRRAGIDLRQSLRGGLPGAAAGGAEDRAGRTGWAGRRTSWRI